MSLHKKRKPKKDPYLQRPHLLSPSFNLKYNEEKCIISMIEKELENIPYDKKMEKIKQYLDFVRIFTTKGVQGIVGLMKIKKENDERCIVFKTSTDINRSIEHEHEVLKDLNNLRNYCPYFVREIGALNIPISSCFIKNPYDNSLFLNEETLPRSILFLEYVNKLPFYRLCDDCNDKNIIMSQILHVLMGLEVIQTKKRITHYDLHTSNILIQTCEINSVFLHKINNKYYLLPTYGFYPLIIDMGISYSNCLNNKQMMSNTDNYSHGFQTTVYDYLNDVHHFLLTTFYYIEVDSDAYDSLSNKIKFIFKNLPALRKSGWKMLPNNLCEEVLDRLKDDCLHYKKYELFDEYDKSSVEILNGLITLPIKNYNNKYFGDCFPVFMVEYHKFIDINDFSENDILFVLKTIVDCIIKHNNVETFKKDIINTISHVLTYNVEFEYSRDNELINYEKLLLSGKVFGERLSSVYYSLIEENNNYIKNKYEKTIIKSPVDIFNYIGRNMTPHFLLNNNTIIYYWNIDDEYNKKLNCGKLSKTILNKINNSFFTQKAELLVKELNL